MRNSTTFPRNSTNRLNLTSAVAGQNVIPNSDGQRGSTFRTAVTHHRPTLLRRCNVVKSLRRKKRVIQMLGVVVAEFFVCWTPLYIMNTWYLFSPHELYGMIGPLGVSLIQLIAYLSSCVNPITYCFMSKGFRLAFFHVFGCHASEHSRYAASSRGIELSIRMTGRRNVYHNSSLKPRNDV